MSSFLTHADLLPTFPDFLLLGCINLQLGSCRALGICLQFVKGAVIGAEMVKDKRDSVESCLWFKEAEHLSLFDVSSYF